MKVFLSHAASDKSFVRDLVVDLRANEVDVWFDEEILSPGDSLTRGIARGLDTADYVVLIVSRAFLASDWAGVEADAAISASIKTDRGRVIPVLIEDVWDQVSPLLANLVFIDFRNLPNIGIYQDGLKRLVAKVRGTKASPVLATRRTVVLCSGGRETQSDGRDFEISLEVGRALGKAGLAMRTGIARGVDSTFAKGASEAVVASGRRIRDFLTCYAAKGYTLDHPYGRVIESKYSSRSQGIPELITDSDVAILIGGYRNTMYLGVLMLLEGKPLLPIASSGGAAADLYNLVMSRFDKSFGIQLDRYKFSELADMSLSPADVAATCLELITLLRGPAPSSA